MKPTRRTVSNRWLKGKQFQHRRWLSNTLDLLPKTPSFETIIKDEEEQVKSPVRRRISQLERMVLSNEKVLVVHDFWEPTAEGYADLVMRQYQKQMEEETSIADRDDSVALIDDNYITEYPSQEILTEIDDLVKRGLRSMMYYRRRYQLTDWPFQDFASWLEAIHPREANPNIAVSKVISCREAYRLFIRGHRLPILDVEKCRRKGIMRNYSYRPLYDVPMPHPSVIAMFTERMQAMKNSQRISRTLEVNCGSGVLTLLMARWGIGKEFLGVTDNDMNTLSVWSNFKRMFTDQEREVIRIGKTDGLPKVSDCGDGDYHLIVMDCTTNKETIDLVGKTDTFMSPNGRIAVFTQGRESRNKILKITNAIGASLEIEDVFRQEWHPDASLSNPKGILPPEDDHEFISKLPNEGAAYLKEVAKHPDKRLAPKIKKPMQLPPGAIRKEVRLRSIHDRIMGNKFKSPGNTWSSFKRKLRWGQIIRLNNSDYIPEPIDEEEIASEKIKSRDPLENSTMLFILKKTCDNDYRLVDLGQERSSVPYDGADDHQFDTQIDAISGGKVRDWDDPFMDDGIVDAEDFDEDFAYFEQ